MQGRPGWLLKWRHKFQKRPFYVFIIWNYFLDDHMTTPLPIRLLVTVFLALQTSLASAAAPVDVAGQCRADLEDIAGFLPVNDSGAADALARRRAELDAALREARTQAAQAKDAAACDAVLQTYLKAWRPGHLSVSALAPAAKPAPAAGTAADPRLPRLQLLGKETLLLVLPSFKDRYQAPLAALLDAHRAELESHRYWIVDVRSNDGGSDVTYEALLPWLLDGEYLEYRSGYLVTPANLRAQEQICGLLSDPAGCTRKLAPVVNAMRKAPAGSFMVADGQRYGIEKPSRVEAKAPRRVAVLTDRECGSSCDQFLLTARTSFRVKLVGRPSEGVIDYANLRPHPLPSGRMLKYATTRSARLPDLPLDGIGVAPDILLPAPQDAAGRDAEVQRVRRWLETGSWRS
jgi:hypothetical protein